MKEEAFRKTAYVKIKAGEKISQDLLKITSLYFFNFKLLCSEEDVLLFIILNIVNLSDKKILLFTSDPVYAFRCSQNILQAPRRKKVCYDLKSFKGESGLCIRGFEESLIKKVKVDFIFNLSICSFLDYKYTPPDKDEVQISFITPHKRVFTNTVYSSQVEASYPPSNVFSDYKSIQLLFLDFRESYKGRIEPERLFDTLLSLYKSIEGLMKGEKEEQYAEFILKNFKDKLI